MTADPLAFLNAALDTAQKQAEAAAARAWSGDWEFDHMVREIRDLSNGNELAHDCLPEIGQFIEANDPAAVLRQIAADRKLIAECERILAVDGWEYDDAPQLAEAAIRNRAEGWGWPGEST